MNPNIKAAIAHSMNPNIAAAISFSPRKTRLPGGVVSTILDVGGFYETAWVGAAEDDFADEERFDDEHAALAYHDKLVRARRGETPWTRPLTPTKPSPTSPPYAS